MIIWREKCIFSCDCVFCKTIRANIDTSKNMMNREEMERGFCKFLKSFRSDAKEKDQISGFINQVIFLLVRYFTLYSFVCVTIIYEAMRIESKMRWHDSYR